MTDKTELPIISALERRRRLYAFTLLASLGNTEPTLEQIKLCMSLVEMPANWVPEEGIR